MAKSIDPETREYLNDIINQSRFRPLHGQAREDKMQEMYVEGTKRILLAWINNLNHSDRVKLDSLQVYPGITNNVIRDFIEEHTPNPRETGKREMDKYAAEFVRS